MLSEQPGLRTLLCIFFFLSTTFFPTSVFAAGGPGEDSTLVGNSSFFKNLFLRYEVVQSARQYLGLSYHYGGRTPETGFDCSGFTSHVMGLFAIPLSPTSRTQALEGEEVPLELVRPGDLITFRRSRKRAVSHVAMVVDNNEAGVFIIHSTSRGVVIDNLNESRYWKPKVFKARDVLSEYMKPAPLPEEKILATVKQELLPPVILPEVPMLPPVVLELVCSLQ